MKNPLEYFAELRDPRVERNREHLLEEILLISIAAVLSGAESWNDIADYGEDKQEWLKTFLTLPSGIPSHDTFNRVFAALDPEEMEKGFVAWVSSIAKLTAGEVVAIDGNALCGTHESGKKTLVHMVSAWTETNGLVLAQRKVDEKSNEITAIPKLLDALKLTGTVVTIDAMGCQREIASRIIDKKADYVLAVKNNQGLLAEQVRDSFLLLESDAVAEQIDYGHGRVEQRKCSVIADLSLIEKAVEWASLQGLVRIESERYHKTSGKIEREIRYYITGLRPDAARLNSVIRQHWGIENKLHWVLDVGFGEDLDRKRAGHAAQNFSVLNRIALNLLKQDKSSKRGIKGKRLKAPWNHPYLLKLIGIWYASALPSRLMALAVRGNCAMDPRGSASVEGVLSQP
jgi:predicted transposase YbfD/YdcC